MLVLFNAFVKKMEHQAPVMLSDVLLNPNYVDDNWMTGWADIEKNPQKLSLQDCDSSKAAAASESEFVPVASNSQQEKPIPVSVDRCNKPSEIVAGRAVAVSSSTPLSHSCSAPDALDCNQKKDADKQLTKSGWRRNSLLVAMLTGKVSSAAEFEQQMKEKAPLTTTTPSKTNSITSNPDTCKRKYFADSSVCAKPVSTVKDHILNIVVEFLRTILDNLPPNAQYLDETKATHSPCPFTYAVDARKQVPVQSLINNVGKLSNQQDLIDFLPQLFFFVPSKNKIKKKFEQVDIDQAAREGTKFNLSDIFVLDQKIAPHDGMPLKAGDFMLVDKSEPDKNNMMILLCSQFANGFHCVETGTVSQWRKMS
eukprot:GHVT01081819.1.p1 GENE.GHVT01081819.1~~GHVT01081819.1.p1  ORF type:complete len:367 (+),score=38.15 GHVT01081819.1:1811-2911(+)